jgi:hypothetical protein
MDIIVFIFVKKIEKKQFLTGPVGQTGQESLFAHYFFKLNIIIAITVFYQN